MAAEEEGFPQLHRGPCPIRKPGEHLKTLTCWISDRRMANEIAITYNYRHPAIIWTKALYLNSIPFSECFTLEVVQEEGVPSNSMYRILMGDLRSSIYGVIDALAFLQEQGYIHGDIKPENLVLVDGVLKLIDFDLMCHSGWYRPIRNQTLTRQDSSDVVSNAMFALGITIAMLTGIADVPGITGPMLVEIETRGESWVTERAECDPYWAPVVTLLLSLDAPRLFSELLPPEWVRLNGKVRRKVEIDRGGIPSPLPFLSHLYTTAAQAGCDPFTTELAFTILFELERAGKIPELLQPYGNPFDIENLTLLMCNILCVVNGSTNGSIRCYKINQKCRLDLVHTLFGLTGGLCRPSRLVPMHDSSCMILLHYAVSGGATEGCDPSGDLISDIKSIQNDGVYTGHDLIVWDGTVNVCALEEIDRIWEAWEIYAEDEWEGDTLPHSISYVDDSSKEKCVDLSHF